jgi:uncharacterized protein (TIGR03435 family)
MLTLAGQQASAPSFEVASVKMAEEGSGPPMFPGMPEDSRSHFQGGPGSKSPERITYASVTLKMLMQRAYNVLREQVAGPDWITKQKYTVEAKLAPGTTMEQFRLMLQGLLNERFQIRMHRETRAVRVYHLVVAKGGPKLAVAEEPGPPVGDEQARAELRAASMDALRARVAALRTEGLNAGIGAGRATTAQIAEMLSQRLERSVIDRTQLEGSYKFTLNWAADGAGPPRDGVPQGPSIFAAVQQQLGLELKAAMEQIEVLVIDAAEKVPAEN